MPNLIIIAGCNGAGKSTFASSFLPEGLTSFDYDRVLIENYNSLPDSELREQLAKKQTTLVSCHACPDSPSIVLLILDCVKKSFIRQLPDYAQIFCLVKNQNNFNLTVISGMPRH